jgi:misacylated tRNA(Ala) deacylase
LKDYYTRSRSIAFDQACFYAGGGGQPPISQGKVRVVEIEGFDAQACGGTHMHNTGEVGRFSIFRTDNKGKNNKRFYVGLT